MTRTTGLVLAGAAVLIAAVAGARWSGGAANAARARLAAKQDTIRDLRRQVRRDSVVINSMATAAFA